MANETDKAGLNRRYLLRALGGASTLAAAAVAAPVIGDAQAASWKDDKRKSRYRESDHIKAFYRVNRY